jgi:hypothetical protein
MLPLPVLQWWWVSRVSILALLQAIIALAEKCLKPTMKENIISLTDFQSLCRIMTVFAHWGFVYRLSRAPL